jgi:GTPase SAR1 family protein
MPKVIPTFKLLLIGDVGVGKSSFIKAYLTGKFDTRYTRKLIYDDGFV